MGECAAYNCKNHAEKGFRMFMFPTNPSRRKLWAKNCSQRDNWKPEKHSVLCEVHFEDSQKENNGQEGWRILKPDAVPTLFIENPPPELDSKVSKKECYECGAEFEKKTVLRRHIKYVHMVGKRSFKCRQCGAEFATKYLLSRHRKCVHMIQRELQACKLCQKNFMSKFSVKRHMKTVHRKQVQIKQNGFGTMENFECDKCNRQFSRKDNLQRHIKCCFRMDQYSFECSYCYKKILTKRGLRSHIRSFHNTDGEKKVRKKKCPLCWQPFWTSKDVEEHLEADHNVQLIYELFEFGSITDFESYMESEPFMPVILTNEWQTETYNAKCFRCHRSGEKPVKIIERKRSEKSGGSKKLDCFCPGSVFVKQSKSDGTCSVLCQKVHVGHSLSDEELRYIPLKRLKK